MLIGIGWILKSIWGLKLVIITNEINSLKRISLVDKNCIEISIDNKRKKYSWKEIESIELEKEGNLQLNLKNQEKQHIGKEFLNYYNLLKNIPLEKLKNQEIIDYRKEIFFNLKTCKICGKIAVRNQECLSCFTDEYNELMRNEYGSEEDYIREEQLDWFGEDCEENRIFIKVDESNDDGFEFDETWQPIITDEELSNYIQLKRIEQDIN